MPRKNDGTSREAMSESVSLVGQRGAVPGPETVYAQNAPPVGAGRQEPGDIGRTQGREPERPDVFAVPPQPSNMPRSSFAALREVRYALWLQGEAGAPDLPNADLA
jgi:hypothetical protein